MTYKHASDLLYLIRCAVNGQKPSCDRIARMDLEQVYREAERHFLTAAAAYALEMADVKKDQFSRAKASAIRKSILLDVDLKTITQKMEAENIWFMPLKGAVIKDLYPFFGMRQMADLDILFDETRTADVKRIMEDSGFRTEYFGGGPHDVYYKDPVSNFEMHRTLFAKGSQFYEYFRDVRKRLLPVSKCKYAFAAEDFYIYMICHEYKHYSGSGTGLRSLLDTYICLKKSELDMSYIEEEVKKLGIDVYERENRSLAHHLFSGRGLTSGDKRMLRYILSSGTYGTMTHFVRNRVKENGGSKIRYMTKRFFVPFRKSDPEYSNFESQYSQFYKHRVLLPALLVFRAGRAVYNGRIVKELNVLRNV